MDPENDSAGVIEVPKIQYFTPKLHDDMDEVVDAVAVDKNVGLPEWMQSPIKISSNLNDSRFTLPIDDPSLDLSQRVQDICKVKGISHLFPVQTAVLKTLLDHLAADQQSWKYCYRYSSPTRHPGDILVSAPTGSGKTLAYVLPIVETLSYGTFNHLQALVVLPTMDLVNQVYDIFTEFAAGSGLKIVAISGGGRAHNEDGISKSFMAEQEMIMGTQKIEKDLEFDALICGKRSERMESNYPKCDVLITTPGRLVDHLSFTPGFTLQFLSWLIVDEADRFLTQNFNDFLQKTFESIKKTRIGEKNGGIFAVRALDDYSITQKYHLLEKVLGSRLDAAKHLSGLEMFSFFGPPRHLRKIFFSATLTRNPGKVAALQLVNPRLIATVNAHEDSDTFETSDVQKYILPSTLKQYYWVCEDLSLKPLFLLSILKNYNLVSTLCFTKSIENAERLSNVVSEFFELSGMKEKFSVAHYSSNLPPAKRDSILTSFKQGHINILICTDALSRGIDIQELQQEGDGNSAIINYDIPVQIKTYVHRVGRTARAGREGQVFNILASHECRHWKESMRKHDLWEGVKSLKTPQGEKFEEMLGLYKQAMQNIRDRIRPQNDKRRRYD